MHYPDSCLDSLEREPIVYFGCTWSEITNAIARGFVVSFPASLALAMLPWPFSRVLVVIPFFLIWGIVTRWTLARIRKLRSGKPLHYERHVRMLKGSHSFLDPATFHQTKRNRHA